MRNDQDKPDPGCGERLKSVRDRLELNQKEFAERLGVSNTLVSQIESGERNLSNSFIKKIAEVFNINPTWLLLGKGAYFLSPYQTGVESDGPLLLAAEPELEDLIRHCLDSQIVKFSVLGFFFRFIRQNKSLIEEEIKDITSRESLKNGNG